MMGVLTSFSFMVSNAKVPLLMRVFNSAFINLNYSDFMNPLGSLMMSQMVLGAGSQ